MAQSAKGAAAFEPGKYNGFTGYVCFADTEAWVEDASFELVPEQHDGIESHAFSVLEHVVWHSGTWVDGVWNDGIWMNGDWLGGTLKYCDWHSGTWHGGLWKDGIWRSGTWLDGLWKTGLWCDGEWMNGTWEYGTWHGGTWLKGQWINGMKLSVTENADGTKMVGLYNPDAMNRITSLELRK